ncbi:hypothetical protein [Streptomyces roseoviridis]|uniref:Gram-positive cocci surface proteins LPxTG domain-containing protein n=1 Tax=Streptomyces roseoviridis TaxID=67361 RepID=A0ABV5QRF2_9ACTN
MRLRNALALAALTTAATVPVAHALAATPAVAALLPAAATPAATPVAVPGAAPGAALAPACGDADATAFPLTARIVGGPVEYAAGGAYGTWHLEIRNTTAGPCRGVHPVLVLTDSGRSLRPDQIRAEFYDATARLWRPVAFEATDRAESVGVFADNRPSAASTSPAPAPASAAPRAPAPSATATRSPATRSPATRSPATRSPATSPPPTAPAPVPAFAGFAVPARGTLTVPVRLAFRADAAPDDDVVVNAAVVQRRGDDGDWVGESGDYRLAIGPADPDADVPAHPSASAPASDPSAPARPTAPGTGTDPRFPELAQTGRESALRHAAAAAALLAAGAVILLAVRRLRNP